MTGNPHVDPQVDPLEEIVASHIESRRHLIEAFDGYAFVRNEDGSLDHDKVALEESERLNAQLRRSVTQLMMAREAEDNQVQDPPKAAPVPGPQVPPDPNHVPTGTSSPPQGSDQESENDDADTHEVTKFDVWLAKHPKLEGFVEKARTIGASLWHRHGDIGERWFTP